MQVDYWNILIELEKETLYQIVDMLNESENWCSYLYVKSMVVKNVLLLKILPTWGRFMKHCIKCT